MLLVSASDMATRMSIPGLMKCIASDYLYHASVSIIVQYSIVHIYIHAHNNT